MSLASRLGCSGAALACVLSAFAPRARAQERALPPLPAPSAPLPPPPPPPPGSAPSDAPSTTAPAPAQYVYAPPPRGPSPPILEGGGHRAPLYSLWLGGGLGFQAYSGGLYIANSAVESTGSFTRPGIAFQGDVGVRLARRFIPYLTLELGVGGSGSRFDGSASTTNASSSFVGLGFRFLMGNVDAVSVAGDVSFGWRKFQVSNATGTWSVGGLEILRLGVGADIRLTSKWSLSPMITFSGGTPTNTGGSITFADGTSPPYQGASGIPVDARTTYFAVVVGCGAHVDLLGR